MLTRTGLNPRALNLLLDLVELDLIGVANGLTGQSFGTHVLEIVFQLTQQFLKQINGK
jgi:hypothetical protein